MKNTSFKEFLQEQKDLNNCLSWDSSFREQRGKRVDEKQSFTWRGPVFGKEEGIERKRKSNDSGVEYDAIHDDPNVRPLGLTPEHHAAIRNYTSASFTEPGGSGASQNMNNYLRNAIAPRGHKNKELKVLGHSPEKVRESVERLSSAFTPENTNKTHIETYSGIPAHIGELLPKVKFHTMAGFTSTSTHPGIAEAFSKKFNIRDKTNEYHLMKMTLKPGTGLSVVQHSAYPEDEIVLNHGARLEYHETTEHPIPGFPNKILKIHHVTVHNERRTIDKYGSYDHPDK